MVALWVLLLPLFCEPGPLQAAERVIKNSLGMEFVMIPAGTFLMGSPPNEAYRDASERLHRVSIGRPFHMLSTEVTLGHWRSVTGRKGIGPEGAGEDVPVFRISWFDCMQFLEKLNALGDGFYRLPTEAEWEYACRAGVSEAYPWGGEIDCTKAMYGNNSRGEGSCLEISSTKGLRKDSPAPAKTYAPNAWGLFDMTGNVWEWCQDWYGEYPSSAVQDPVGPASGNAKVRRGGGWMGRGPACRSANRAYSHPASRLTNTGFRVLREIR
jgi:formylglycine-generating enzyme required for sulfatase activity